LHWEYHVPVVTPIFFGRHGGTSMYSRDPFYFDRSYTIAHPSKLHLLWRIRNETPTALTQWEYDGLNII